MSLRLVVFFMVVVIINGIATSTTPSDQSSLSLPGCQSKCGDVIIPYPFGIGKGCYYNKTNDGIFYKITCDETYNPPKLIYGIDLEVLNISLPDHKMRVSSFIAERCYDSYGNLTWGRKSFLKLIRFSISTSDNVFAAIGCDTYGWLLGSRDGKPFSTGCMTICDNPNDVVNGTCSGLGCCQTSIPDGVTNIDSIIARSFYNHTNVSWFNPCSSAFVVAKDVLTTFSLANVTAKVPSEGRTLPVIVDWMIGTEDCSIAQANNKSLCLEKSVCIDSTTPGVGYRCQCLDGFSGNPYLPDGCQDVDECKDKTRVDICEEPAICRNTIGGYTCECPKEFHTSSKKINRCEADKKANTEFVVVIGVCCSIITLILLAVWLYMGVQKKQLQKERENFFRQNGGHLLHQKLSDGEDVSVEMVKIFTNEDLDKATNKYINVVGKGGFGTVYKGVLANKQVVAIKRSLKVDPKQSDQFINEVILLSKLNHRNVVKLIGCCLETEVPLLVYEFIDNGTLYHHLHDDGKSSLLTWSIRLKIASEVANVLSYLHSAISMPIIHRDMKSSNILLDTNYTAKVSDFGDSRLVPTDQDYLSTAILGTRGYLDPEYIQTNELTAKSDVYSFGVVLTELLTGQEALSYERPKSDVCLAILFIRKWKGGGLTEILDDKISRDCGVMEQVIEVANIAQKCLKHKSDERPTMEEVAMELHKIRKMAGSFSWPKRSGIVLQENHSTAVDIEMSYSKGNTTDSSNHSQVVDLFAAPLESGR